MTIQCISNHQRTIQKNEQSDPNVLFINGSWKPPNHGIN